MFLMAHSMGCSSNFISVKALKTWYCKYVVFKVFICLINYMPNATLGEIFDLVVYGKGTDLWFLKPHREDFIPRRSQC